MDGTDLLVGRLGEGSISRGCVASALLDARGALIESQPEGMAFPAAVLTVIQHQIRTIQDSAFTTPIGPHYVADVRRLGGGRILVNLLMRPGPVASAGRYEPPPRTVFIRIAPTIRTDWEDGARPVEAPPDAHPEPAARAESELPTAEPELPAAEPELPTAEPESTSIAPGPVEAEHAQVPGPDPPGDRPTLVLTAEPYEAEFDLQPGTTPVAPAPPPVAAWSEPWVRGSRKHDLDWRRVLRAGLVILVLAGLVAGWPVVRPLFEASRHPTPTSTPNGGASLTLVPASPPAVVPVLVPFDATLAHGDSGDGVRLLQARLRQLGYFTYPDDTGYFGDATYGALFNFQQARGLPTDGVASTATIAALNACDQACAYRGGGA